MKKPTNKCVTIVQHTPKGDEINNQHVYLNEYDREFILVNRCFIPLDRYELDPNFSVYHQ